MFKKKDLSVEEQKKQALDLSIKEGSACAVMTGAGHSFITPFALALSASNLQIGFLSSFIGLIGPLSQLKSSHLMEYYSRKKIVVTTVLISALMWLPVMLLGLMFCFNFWLAALPVLLIIIYSIHIGIGAVAGPAWFSWMGDLVAFNRRGRYFSKRRKIAGAVAIISMLVAGFVLDYFKTKGLVLVGFTIIFTVAMLARVYSIFLFKRIYNPKMKLKKGYYFSFWDFLKRCMENNFGRFAVFVGLIHLAVAISSPFFAVYMLKELGFTYKWFTFITLSSSVFSLIALPFWGRFTDKYGNRLALVLSSIFIPIVPILWIFSPSKFYLLLVPSLIGGVFWGGFNLAVFNFIFDSVKPNHRALCVTYHNVLMGIGIFIGSIIGGLIAKFIPVTFMSIFLFIFLVSGIARALIAIIFLPKIKEVRHTKKPPILMKEVKLFQELGHGVNHFNSGMIHSAHMPRVRTGQFKEIGKIFVGE